MKDSNKVLPRTITVKDLAKIQKVKQDLFKNADYTNFKQTIEYIIETYELVKKSHVVAYFGVANETFYRWCNNYDEKFGLTYELRFHEYVNVLLDNNKIKFRSIMLKNWIDPSAPAPLQKEAYKILCDSSEDGLEELARIQNLAYAEKQNNYTIQMPEFDESESE